MRFESIVSISVSGVILLTVLASGPFVPGIDLTAGQEQQSEVLSSGAGTVTVDSVKIPSTPSLTKSKYGAGVYHLRIPESTLVLKDITGEPLLVYKLHIEELNYVHGQTFFLTSDAAGPLTVSAAQKKFAPDRITQDSYNAEFVILLRVNGTDTVLHQETATVTVDR